MMLGSQVIARNTHAVALALEKAIIFITDVCIFLIFTFTFRRVITLRKRIRVHFWRRWERTDALLRFELERLFNRRGLRLSYF
jgi:hypothetical protein